jgi:hypothetical protein
MYTIKSMQHHGRNHIDLYIYITKSITNMCSYLEHGACSPWLVIPNSSLALTQASKKKLWIQKKVCPKMGSIYLHSIILPFSLGRPSYIYGGNERMDLDL